MNELIPFKFKAFQADEAIYSSNNIDWVKRYRFTRKAIGQFLHPETKRHQKIIDNIIERNPHLKELSIPLTVRGKTGQEFEAGTYDIWGIHQICIESNLPRKKEFLRGFPDFILALQSGKIKPILPPNEKMLRAMGHFKEIAETPHGHKMNARIKLSIDLGIGVSTNYRWEQRLRETGHLGYKYSEGQRKRTERDRIPEWRIIAEAYLQGQGKKSQTEIARFFGCSVAKVNRIIRKYIHRLGGINGKIAHTDR